MGRGRGVCVLAWRVKISETNIVLEMGSNGIDSYQT